MMGMVLVVVVVVVVIMVCASVGTEHQSRVVSFLLGGGPVL